MAWTKPVIREIECGMEINMYGPENEDERETLI
ncbi:MAG: pyrroloquinoline quinone precursor peptide PqqA [Pseudomonadota bacterium]